MAVHRQPLPAATLQHEGSPAGARERPAIRAGHLGQPSTRDPRAVTRCVDVSARLEVKAADTGPDVLPLLAHDVVETGHGAGPRAEGDRVCGEQGAAAREIAGAHGGLE